MKRSAVLVCACVFVFLSVPAAAQDTSSLVEMLRTDIKSEKINILTEALALSDSQGAAFWPLYREYDVALNKILDQRIALVREYMDSYDSMTEEAALSLGKRVLGLEDSFLKLRKSSFQKVAKQVSPTVAGRWLQVESAIQKFLDLQVGLAMPLIEKTAESPKK